MKLDALLYVLLGTLPTAVAMLSSDSAIKYISAQAIFWITCFLAIAGSAAGNLKAFRSQSFSNYLLQRDKDKATTTSVVATSTVTETKPVDSGKTSL